MTLRQSPDRHLYATDAERWTAVVQRDAAADEAFVYAVVTTGVYCRASCPSRRPKRANVSFHATAADAVAAGYRACRRCRPDRPRTSHRHEQRVLEACRRIEQADERLSLDELAAGAGLSPYHFQRVFKEIVGLTPKQYEKAQRERRARDGLSDSGSVTEAIYASGYGSSGRFYADAPATIGMRPATRRARGKGERIRFAVGQCSLGAILVATTDRGICSIAIGDEPDRLVEELQRQFADAKLIGGDAKFETIVANVVGLIENPAADVNLPLDIRGTAFQKKVWQALTTISAGDTATYREVAEMIGKPTAVRAVAGACGANRLAVAIPCHRVVRSDGSMSGYRWGVERKRALLAREAAT